MTVVLAKAVCLLMRVVHSSHNYLSHSKQPGEAATFPGAALAAPMDLRFLRPAHSIQDSSKCMPSISRLKAARLTFKVLYRCTF